MAIKPEDLKKMTSAQRATLKKAELAARLKAQMKKSSTSTSKRPAPKAMAPKPKTSSTAKPKAKKPTLDDFLLKGKRPPMKPGLKVPSDADVILKGYNDSKTLNKYKKK